MTVKSVAQSISGVFNWLNSEPKKHWTLRELLPVITDGHINPTRPRQINRVARAIERVATVAGLAGGAYMGVLEHSIFPLLVLPIAAQAFAYITGGVLTMMLNSMQDRAHQFESWATSREFKKQNKAAQPRHLR